MLISPIFKDGSADIDRFFEFLKTKYKATDVEDLIETLNHGTLCPTACPDEGR